MKFIELDTEDQMKYYEALQGLYKSLNRDIIYQPDTKSITMMGITDNYLKDVTKSMSSMSFANHVTDVDSLYGKNESVYETLEKLADIWSRQQPYCKATLADMLSGTKPDAGDTEIAFVNGERITVDQLDDLKESVELDNFIEGFRKRKED